MFAFPRPIENAGLGDVAQDQGHLGREPARCAGLGNGQEIRALARSPARQSGMLCRLQMPWGAHFSGAEAEVGLFIAEEPLSGEVPNDLAIEANGDVADMAEGIATH